MSTEKLTIGATTWVKTQREHHSFYRPEGDISAQNMFFEASGNGRTYYAHKQSKRTCWALPDLLAEKGGKQGDILSGDCVYKKILHPNNPAIEIYYAKGKEPRDKNNLWVKHQSPCGKAYFSNKGTGRTMWHLPFEPEEKEPPEPTES
eukprot:TRINITY_DN68034_c7_g1_i1.p2 TRINITY_DN68034_c7_g1~~TRINITY_DN68034_c7_g1_i1.p2  ORF type:complete len:148 (-),score=8.94 TRINITY_DN68034_c7_g1_i1:206-649(-)